MRILTGIQPSGTAHLGNYFGMMKPALEMQGQGELFLFIADLHALTTVRDPAALRRFSHELALDLLACGLEPERTVLFRQSDVPAVTELAWVLSTITPQGLLERCHSYKDKTSRGLPVTHGLFSYPVLMAADILIYNSDVVPVGKDQKQHLEVARDLAVKFNETWGPVLKLPEPRIQEETAVVPGTDGAKMSKSYGNTIEMFADEAVLKKRVMSIKTDSTPVEAPKNPEGSTLLALYRLVAGDAAAAEMAHSFRSGGKGYGEYKKQLLGALLDYFAPMRQRRSELAKTPERVEEILREGAKRANTTAAEVMRRVRRAVGLD